MEKLRETDWKRNPKYWFYMKRGRDQGTNYQLLWLTEKQGTTPFTSHITRVFTQRNNLPFSWNIDSWWTGSRKLAASQNFHDYLSTDSIRLVMLFLKDLLKWTTLLCLEQQQLSCRKSCRAFAAVCQRMPWVSNEGGMVSDSILLLLNLSCMPVTSCIGSHNLGRTWEQALKGRRRCAETRIL